MTIEHRREFTKHLDDYDLFVYTEDDMHFDLRHLAAYAKESDWVSKSSLSDKYLVGYQRYEENGIGMGHTQVIWENSADAWFPLEIDGRLFMMPQVRVTKNAGRPIGFHSGVCLRERHRERHLATFPPPPSPHPRTSHWCPTITITSPTDLTLVTHAGNHFCLFMMFVSCFPTPHPAL